MPEREGRTKMNLNLGKIVDFDTRCDQFEEDIKFFSSWLFWLFKKQKRLINLGTQLQLNKYIEDLKIYLDGIKFQWPINDFHFLR